MMAQGVLIISKIKILLHCVQIFIVQICTQWTEPHFSGGVGVGVKSQS